jgi:catechol-2,3-dioxygenase
MPKVRHLAFFSDNPEKLAKFYTEVIGMQIKGRGKTSVWLTDGYLDIALLKRTEDSHITVGLNHFGVTLEPDEKEGVYQRLAANGHAVYKPPLDRSYVEDYVTDVDGNKFDLSTSEVRVGADNKSVFKNPSKTPA